MVKDEEDWHGLQMVRKLGLTFQDANPDVARLVIKTLKLDAEKKAQSYWVIQVGFASCSCLWSAHIAVTVAFVFHSTKEYNECLHDIQRALSEIMNGATREFLQSKR